ncbi:uncharacterized protein G2W53_007351 [Senna tora]|uniref:Uncharacterized protein n=1 Tax=Senna tora TaxID=362788 RepID=A0A834X682_9FABA|nr:uncharacterized protein G2W53_007351 [Senna tora]
MELMIARATQRRRAMKESMMLLLKVPVTSIEGVDDSTSYAMVTSKEGVNDAPTKGSDDKHGSMEGVDDGTKVLATCMEEFNDVTTNGSRDKCERVDDVTHPSCMKGVCATKDSREQSIPSGSQASNESSFFLPLTSLLAQCEQRQQGRAKGCVEGFDDSAIEDSDSHVKFLPCSDIPSCDNKEMLKVILSADFSLKTKQDGILRVLKYALTECGKCITFIRWGGDDQPWMLEMSKGTSLLSARGGERLQTLGMSEGASLEVNFYIESCCVGFLHFASWRFKEVALLLLLQGRRTLSFRTFFALFTLCIDATVLCACLIN